MSALPKAVIFDCDGTILDSMGAWIEASPRRLAEYCIEPPHEDFAQFEHLPFEAEFAEYLSLWGIA